MSLSKKLRRIRANLEMTQWEFAKAIDVTQSAVHIWEAGKGEPKRRTLIKIAELAGVPLNHLIDTAQVNKPIKIDGELKDGGILTDVNHGVIDSMIAIPENARAAVIADGTMFPLMEGWVVIYMGNGKVAPANMNQLAIIHATGHGKRLAVVRKDRGSKELWLESPCGGKPIINAKVTAIYPVISLQPKT